MTPEDKKPLLSAEQRAEKIWVQCNKYFLANQLNGKVVATAENWIAAQIREASDAAALEAYRHSDKVWEQRLREAVEEARKSGWNAGAQSQMTCTQENITLAKAEAYEEGVADGKREAFENAAKMLDAEASRVVRDKVPHSDIISGYVGGMAGLVLARAKELK